MKLATLLVVLYVAFACWLLSGCSTTYDEDGNKTTRFDGDAFNTVVKTSGDIYDRYRRQQQPGYYQQPVQQPAAVYPYPTYAPTY